MAEVVNRFVKYGDRKMAIDAGLTLEQVKGIMARHFPELGDPEVKTETKDGETVYTFAKKAGKKGGRRNARVVARLAQLKPTPVVPAEIVKLYTTSAKLDARRYSESADLHGQAKRVARTRRALLELRPLPQGEGGELL